MGHGLQLAARGLPDPGRGQVPGSPDRGDGGRLPGGGHGARGRYNRRGRDDGRLRHRGSHSRRRQNRSRRCLSRLRRRCCRRSNRLRRSRLPRERCRLRDTYWHWRRGALHLWAGYTRCFLDWTLQDWRRHQWSALRLESCAQFKSTALATRGHNWLWRTDAGWRLRKTGS